MLTSRALKYIAIFIALFIAGLLLGNRVLLVMSLIPFGLLVIGLFINNPQPFKIVSQPLPGRVWVGEVLEVRHQITVHGGMGPFILHQDLPPHFALESGNNLRAYWKGWQPLSVTLEYRLRCTKRGSYTLLPLKYSSRHVIWLKPPIESTQGENHPLVVFPRIMNVRNIRGVPAQAIAPYPTLDIAKIGVTTTDFREIRRYVPGDPIKNINWKATARVVDSNPWPLTNEYEVEGKKSVWVFLDSSKTLEVGNDIENAFEYSLEAANAVIYYYINRGYRTGLYVFNNMGQLYYPDTGKKQFIKISRQLLNLQAGFKVDEFPLAVEKSRTYILGFNPLCIVITRLDSRFAGHIITGIRLLRHYAGRQRRRLPVMVINIPAYGIVKGMGDFDQNAALMMQLNTRPRVNEIRSLGAAVIDWNPLKENLNAVMLRTLKTR
jgi:uncharacterized protein (DUF58 family)